MPLLHRVSALLALPALALILTSCNGSHVSPPVAGSALQGSVFGGQQPITGATIKLYAVNATTDGGASTSLLTTPVVTSDGSGTPGNTLGPGYFSITADYTCPTAGTLVYLTAAGGNPGLAAGTNNAGAVNLAALGTCGNLQTNVQFISINELTTVGAVAALYPYLTGYTAIGSTPANATALATAFDKANQYVNFQNGQAPGPALPNGYYASTTELNTLADVIAACVNTSGAATYNDGTVCGNLFYLSQPTPNAATAPTDTVGALLNILNQPTNNVTAIFNLQGSITPFLPKLSTAPTDWMLPILPQPGTPAFSVPGGSYAAGQSVSITDSDPTAVLYYTTDGSTPSASSTVYTAPVSITSTQTLKAIAIESARLSSAVTSATYTLATPAAAPPVFSPAAGTYTAAQTVTITSATAGATLYYTTDGSTPTTSSSVYPSGGIVVSVTRTLRALAVASGFAPSAVISAAYIINNTPAIISTFAGSGAAQYSCCDGVAATAVELYGPYALAIDSVGNTYLSDIYAHTVRKIDTAGLTTTVAGNGTSGNTGNGGPATSAALNNPVALAVDSSGNLYIADSGSNQVRKVTPGGTISLFAGTGTATSTGDGGQAASATLNQPYGVAVDSSNNVYIADTGGNRIRKVTTAGIITTIAGTGSLGYSDGSPATSYNLGYPRGLAIDSSGALYIADSNNGRIRKLVSTTISTVASGLSTPYAVAVDAAKTVTEAEYGGNRIRQITASGTTSVIAGTGTAGSATPDGATAATSTVYEPQGVAVDASGNVLFTEYGDARVRKINTSGILGTFAGSGSGYYSSSQDGHLATLAQIQQAYSSALDAAGNLYFVDTFNNLVRKVDTNGIITTIAGNGFGGYNAANEGGPALNALLNNPNGIAVTAAGIVYIADTNNSRIRKIAADGTITTVAGTGTTAYSSTEEGAPATSANLNNPKGISLDSAGNLYIADTQNNRIRKVDTSGNITSIAGTGTATYVTAQDGALAVNASVNAPRSVTADSTGNIYIADTGNNRIRRIDTSGKITTFAGNGSAYSGDNGAATLAGISAPYQVALDPQGNVYIAEYGSYRIRKVNTGGTITTYAGTGTLGTTGDGGAANAARIGGPRGVSTDSAGNLYICDSQSHIRKVTH